MRAPEPFEIDAGGNYPVRGEAFLADVPRGGIVICHGFKGFAHWAFFPYLARALATAGLNAITFDFSGSGIGPDRESFTQLDAFANNTFAQELEDVSAVTGHANGAGWLDETFGLFGHSRGGATAIVHAANEPKVNALVTWAAIARPNRWTRDAVMGWRERGYVEILNSRTGQVLRLGTPLLDEVESLGASTLDFESAAGRVRAPWLIVHGTADETVDCSEGERLHERSKAVSTLRLVFDANHGFEAKHPVTEPSPNLDVVVRETVAFFAAHSVRL